MPLMIDSITCPICRERIEEARAACLSVRAIFQIGNPAGRTDGHATYQTEVGHQALCQAYRWRNP